MRQLTFWLISACVAIAVHHKAEAVDFVGQGATAPALAYKAWGDDYRSQGQGNLIYKPTSAGDGIQAIKENKVDFCATGLPLKPQELEQYKLIQFPTMIAAMVPVINIHGVAPGKLRLTGELLVKIFSGELRNWNDPDITAINPGLTIPAIPIRPLVRADDAGMTYTFTSYLSAVSPAWRTKYGAGLKIDWSKSVMQIRGVNGVLDTLAQTNGGISYVDYSYVVAFKLAYVQLRNRDSAFVAPGEDSFKSAVSSSPWGEQPDVYESLLDRPGKASWPIVDATFIVMHKNPSNPDTANAAKMFFFWSFVRGDAMISNLNFTPLPSRVQSRVVKNLNL